MASLPTSLSVEELTEDLDLHEALLKSLIETRPDAVEEAVELETTIKQLQRQLAQRRGIIPRSGTPSPQRASRPLPALSAATNHRQFPESSSSASRRSDFAFRRPTSPSRGANRLPSPRHERSSPSAPRSLSSTPRPSNRMTSRLDSSSEPVGSDSVDPVDSVDAEDALHQLLGIDDSFREGQYEAEKWLQERREQERQDAELARRLQAQWEDPLSGLSGDSSPTSAQPSWPPDPEYPSSTVPRGTMDIPPPYGTYHVFPPMPVPPTSAQLSAAQHPYVASFFNHNAMNMAPPARTQNPAESTATTDSSDSDIAEISPDDFHRRVQYVRLPVHTFIPTQWPSAKIPPRSPPDLQASREMMVNALTSTAERVRRMGENLQRRYNNALLAHHHSDNEIRDSRQAQAELKEMLENLRPDIEMSKDKWEGTPPALQFPLLDHQKAGLGWMKTMEEGSNKGGILADDMGLGKTMQAIALMVSRPSTDPARKTTLIVAPVALMQQWSREISRMLRDGFKLKTFILHGDKRRTTFDKLRGYDVVLTTFGTLASELNRREEWENRRRYAGQNGANLFAEASSMPLLGPGCTWYRIIIDEAQFIKNRTTRAALACCFLNATYRWCMSGTPMMNNVGELHSLLRFLRIRPYSSLELFTKDFTKPLKSNNPNLQRKALQQLQVVLKTVLLRRTKYSKIDGKPILNLPPRVTEKVHAVFSKDEEELYKALETQTQIQFNKYLKSNSIGRNYSNILVLLLRLRQACCHPHLINDLSVDVTAVTGNVDLIQNAKHFSPEVVRRLRENEPLECPVCIDAVENPVIFYPCGHATCAECFARISDPALAIQQGYDGQVEAKCPNCRAKIDPKKVTDNVSFKKVYCSQGGSTDTSVAPEHRDGDNDEESGLGSDLDESDESDNNDSDLEDFIVPDGYNGSADSHSRKRKRGRKGKGRATKKSKKTLAVLRKEGQRNASSKRKYFKRIEKNWQPSAKIEKALEILETVRDAGQGEKTIIFSQFTSLLDLLEVPIHRNGWKYRRYDGSMRPSERNEAVMEFTDNAECNIMLVSLKAGNSGLNLVAASQVIIFDPFWNPYIEEQAIDRAHRLGQTRTVQIHRILIPGTVEDRILELQDKKREIIEGALDENAAKQISRLGITELRFLFNMRDSI